MEANKELEYIMKPHSKVLRELSAFLPILRNAFIKTTEIGEDNE